MYPTSSSVDAHDILKEVGGENRNIMGYDGYYEDLSDAYAFSFVKDNKMVTVYSSSPDIFGSVEVV